MLWAPLLVLGPPGLLLTVLHDPEHLPIALTVIIGGTLFATAMTLHIRRRSERASHMPERGGNR
jgi:hypothetical protein